MRSQSFVWHATFAPTRFNHAWTRDSRVSQSVSQAESRSVLALARDALALLWHTHVCTCRLCRDWQTALTSRDQQLADRLPRQHGKVLFKGSSAIAACFLPSTSIFFSHKWVILQNESNTFTFCWSATWNCLSLQFKNSMKKTFSSDLVFYFFFWVLSFEIHFV